MARKNGVEASQGEMLPFDDAELDVDSANQLMINRERFEALGPADKARVAGAIISMPFAGMMATGGVKGDVAAVEDEFQRFIGGALDAVESTRKGGDCTLCEMPFEPDEDRVDQQIAWVAEGRRVMSEPTGEVAHHRCIKRVREGGDAGEKPLF
ncbi:hypothetical protein AB0F25_30660 [Streptomyces wedmorensis]|uniref:hypothetical protein n=1 Tax=Streptomyces wedmorensis TaxID=43759 RepID=UPI003441BF3F